MTLRPILALFLLCGLFSAQAVADSFSCDGGIVSTGDSSADLVVKCGQPDWTDSHDEKVTTSLERIDPSGKHIRQTNFVHVEEWTYNIGPDRFMRMVTIRNGTVTGIRTGGYGTAKEPEAASTGCGDRIISVGETKADVLAKCGEPFTKTSHQEALRQELDRSTSRTVFVTVEEWTYNFGPDRFMRVITLRNGKVTDIRTAGYGTRGPDSPQ
jgi:hypothetical protein